MNDVTNPFSNASIDPASLPDFREAALTPVVPAYLKHKVTTTVAFWSLPILAALLSPLLPVVEIDRSHYVLAGASVIMLMSLLHARFDARHRGWALREHDLIYRSGVIFRKQVILPFARIQHVETLSGPIERYFDIMRVKCFTAGGQSADLVVEGLTTERAGQVRQYLLEQIRDDEPEEASSNGPESASQASPRADD